MIPRTVYSPEHEIFRDAVRRFVEREIMPHVDQWDEAEEFPRELYRKASAAGLLGEGAEATRPRRASGLGAWRFEAACRGGG